MQIQSIDRIERQITRLREARPAMSARIDRAEHLLTTQLSVSNGRRPITARANGRVHSYRVRSGSKLSRTYTVERDSWSCNCPSRKTCYHVIGCWLLERAGA